MIAESTATQLALMHAPLPFPKLVERIKGTGGIPFAASLRATPSHASPGEVKLVNNAPEPQIGRAGFKGSFP